MGSRTYYLPVTPFKIIKQVLDNEAVEEFDRDLKITINCNSENKIIVKTKIWKPFVFAIRARENFTNTREGYITSYIRNVGEHEVIFVQESLFCLMVYWVDPKMGLTEMAKLIMASLELATIHRVMIDVTFMNKEFVDWVKDFNGNVTIMIVSIEFGESRNMRYLIENCNKAKFLGFHCNPNVNLQYRPRFNADDLFIDKAHGVDLPKLILLSNQAVSVTLFDCSVLSATINAFLKHWMSSSQAMKMKYLYVTNGGMLPDGVVSGIDHAMVDSETRRRFKVHDEYSVIFSGGMDITREDGALASVCATQLIRDPPNKIIVEIYFWPDFDGSTFSPL